MTIKETLLKRLEDRSARPAIIGLGYVGLPLAVELAEAGFTVIGVDVDVHKVEQINQGRSYIPDIPDERLHPLVESGQLCATTDYDDLRRVDTANICVPTPLSPTRDPDMTYVISAVSEVARVAHPGMLIALESTTYPGTTQELLAPRLLERGFTIGEDVFLAFSGERIDPGNKTYTLRNTPKVIGGVTPDCSEVAVALYSACVDTVVPVSSPATAEMVKLLENTFRAVNIALANEMAVMCEKLGIDVWEVIKAASTKPFGFMPFYPGPGPGGHCIPLDPHYLSWKMKTLDYNARFIELASEINSTMPAYVVGRLADMLNDESKALRGSNIVILGVAYKRDIDDVRESPALAVIDLLRHKGVSVRFHDPHVKQIRLGDGKTMPSSPYNDDFLSSADCVVILTDHSDYDWDHVLGRSRVILDTRNATHAHRRDYPETKIVPL